MPFSRAGLVREARGAGWDANERMVTEWVRLGLLDRPERVSRRDGKRGAHYQWPDTQRDLLLALLAKRPEVSHTKSLVQMPVGVWLYWGEEWIPTRQVQRALVTWTELLGPPRSYERALANARQVVRTFARPGSPREATNGLRDTLAAWLHRGTLDSAHLHRLVTAVLAHDPQTGGWGPFGFDVDDVMRWLMALTTAVWRVESISDGQLHEARARQRAAILDYARSWRMFARLATYGAMFEEPTLEVLLGRSCRDILEHVGIRMLADEQGWHLPPVGLIEWHHPPMDLIRLHNRTAV